MSALESDLLAALIVLGGAMIFLIRRVVELFRLDCTVDIPIGRASQCLRPPWKCLPLLMRSFRPPIIDSELFGAGACGGGGIVPDGIGGSGTVFS